MSRIAGDVTMDRCGWCGSDELYMKYHDEEWGVPVHDDQKHFEFLVLESAQAGLSWITILRKRENYRRLYDQFDVCKVAEYGEDKILSLMADPGIIRNRRKIDASINNAKCFLEVQKEWGSFDEYIWSFTNKIAIMIFVWAFSSSEKKSKANFFKAMLIIYAIVICIYIIIFIIFGAAIIAAVSNS